MRAYEQIHRASARAFIAINFSANTRSRLLGLRDELQSNSRYGKFSPPENLHLTLAFLGECDAKQTAAAKAVLDALTFEPFAITIDHVGHFKRDGGDIWWAGVRDNTALSNLQSELTARLHGSGFMLENRKYSPHITLARGVVSEYVFGKTEPLRETVTGVELMKSERISGKLTYTAIHRRVALRH